MCVSSLKRMCVNFARLIGFVVLNLFSNVTTGSDSKQLNGFKGWLSVLVFKLDVCVAPV